MIALMRYVTLVSAHSMYSKGSPQDGMVLETHPAVCEEECTPGRYIHIVRCEGCMTSCALILMLVSCVCAWLQ